MGNSYMQLDHDVKLTDLIWYLKKWYFMKTILVSNDSLGLAIFLPPFLTLVKFEFIPISSRVKILFSSIEENPECACPDLN